MAASTKTISIEHVVIPSKRTFESTKSAIESLIPELDMKPIKTLVDSGDNDGALAAMEALPSLNIFDIRPRNVGPLIASLNYTNKAAQYSIGHPLTAMRMAQWQVGVGLYPPFRVLLHETSGPGKVTVFEYDRPASLLAQFGDERVNELMQPLDDDLAEALATAAGWERFGQWTES